MACPPEAFARLAADLRARHSWAEWDLVCFYDPGLVPPEGTTFLRSRRTPGFLLRLWLAALRRAYGAVYVVLDDLERPDLPLLQFAALLPRVPKVLLDTRGAVGSLTPRDGAAAVLAALATPPLLALARLLTCLGLAAVRPRPAQPPAPAAAPRVGLVVPVLPDLSHTFVYREVLALTRRHPEWVVLVLEPGDRTVVHGEAALLESLAVPVPRLSPSRYLLAYLRHWLRRPRAMADLIRFFQPHTASFGPGAVPDDRWGFLRLPWLHHVNHLAPGLMLAEAVRRQRLAYLHVYGATYPAVRALVAHRLLGVPFSLSTFVDFDYVTPFHMLRPKLGLARFVVVATAFCASRLAERFPDLGPRLRVLRPSVPSDYALGKELRPRDGRSRLVYIGRFVPKKGLDTLVEACALLRGRGLEVSCHLYGRGELEGALRARIAASGLTGAVVLEAPVPNERIYGVMNRDDVFVCPSRYMPDGERDGIPVALIEAMAAGITVVSTPVSGIPELIEDGANGYLVPPDDPVALADVLATLLGSEARRAAVADAARRTVAEVFSLEAAAAALDGWISRESRSGA